MKFYNRDSELQFLAEVQARASRELHLTLLLGRRQVGKTLLIRKHIEASRTPSLYFFVSRKSRETLLEEFSEILATRISVLQNVHLTEFGTFFKILFDFLDEHLGLVVFDEFQNFQHVDPSVFSVLQKHWEDLVAVHQLVERREAVPVVRSGKRMGVTTSTTTFWHSGSATSITISVLWKSPTSTICRN